MKERVSQMHFFLKEVNHIVRVNQLKGGKNRSVAVEWIERLLLK